MEVSHTKFKCALLPAERCPLTDDKFGTTLATKFQSQAGLLIVNVKIIVQPNSKISH